MVLPGTLLAVLPALALQDPVDARLVKETAYARIGTAQRIAADAELLVEVASKNASGETIDRIRRTDAEWTRRADFPLRKELTQSVCAYRLRRLVEPDPLIVEALLMDARGALVCSTVETSDYYQGDEPKWLKTYSEGQRVFIDEPALDGSTKTYAIQLSVPVQKAGDRIGALTLTLRLPGGGGGN